MKGTDRLDGGTHKGRIPLFCAQITYMYKTFLLHSSSNTSVFCIGAKMLITELKICFMGSNMTN